MSSLPGGKSPNPVNFSSSKGSAAPLSTPTPGATIGGADDDFFNEDFDNITTFTPLAEGEYEAWISEVVNTFSQNGNPQLEFTFTVAEGQESAGRRQKYWLVKTPKTLWKIKQFLEALGIPEESMRGFSPKQTVGRYAIIKMGTDSYDPDRVKVLDVLPSQLYYGKTHRAGSAQVPGIG